MSKLWTHDEGMEGSNYTCTLDMISQHSAVLCMYVNVNIISTAVITTVDC